MGAIGAVRKNRNKYITMSVHLPHSILSGFKIIETCVRGITACDH